MKKWLLGLVILSMTITTTAMAKQSINVLWYGQSQAYNEAIRELAINAESYDPNGDGSLDWNLTLWDEQLSYPNFAAFDVLVIGSTLWSVTSPEFNPAKLLKNKIAIESARGTRTFLTGQDADMHYWMGDHRDDGPRGFLINAVNWAASGIGLGIVIMPQTWFGEPYRGYWVFDSNSFLRKEFLNNIMLFPDYASEESVIIPDATRTFPVNEGLTSVGLSNWGQSAHVGFKKDLSGYFPINDAGSLPGYAVTIVTNTEADGGTWGEACDGTTPAILTATLFADGIVLSNPSSATRNPSILTETCADPEAVSTVSHPPMHPSQNGNADLHFEWHPETSPLIEAVLHRSSGAAFFAIMPQKNLENVNSDTWRQVRWKSTMTENIAALSPKDVLLIRNRFGRWALQIASQRGLLLDMRVKNFTSCGGIFFPNDPLPTVTPSVPEPSSWLLFGIGLIGVFAVLRRTRQKYSHSLIKR